VLKHEWVGVLTWWSEALKEMKLGGILGFWRDVVSISMGLVAGLWGGRLTKFWNGERRGCYGELEEYDEMVGF